MYAVQWLDARPQQQNGISVPRDLMGEFSGLFELSTKAKTCLQIIFDPKMVYNGDASQPALYVQNEF
jgi:hypothetical protein